MKIEGSMDLESILLKNAKTGEERSLPIAGCFVAIGHEPDTRLVEGQVYLDSQGYIIAGFGETAADDTRLLVLDQNGQEVFRSADVAQRPQIDHDRLFYITKDGRSYLVPLQ